MSGGLRHIETLISFSARLVSICWAVNFSILFSKAISTHKISVKSGV